MARQVILLMTDTQRFDMVGCYGYPDMKTPGIDSLAAGGVRFDRAYTCQPVCGAARAGLFTGLWPHSNGGWSNNMPLGADVRTVAQHVEAAGLLAAYIGKWHLDASDYFGTGKASSGWDQATWYDMRNYLQELSETDRVRSRLPATNRDPALTADFTFGHRCSNRAIEFLETHQGENFFLTVSYDEPHHPFLCPKPFSEMYRDYEFPKRPNLWDGLTNKPEHQRVWSASSHQLSDDEAIKQADYLGCNAFVDSEIHRVVRAIDRFAPDALVIYTSDHGEALHSHRITNKGPVMYEEVIRIPLIVRWPDRAPAGAICSNLASHIDLTPTILAALEIPIPKAVQGHNMIETITQPGHTTDKTIFCEFGRYEIDHDGFGGFQPIRAGLNHRYKLVINLLSSDELYDLKSDPYEMENLIDDSAHAVSRNQLHDRILDWMNDTRDPFRGYYWERRPWRLDAPPASWHHAGMTRQPDTEPRLLDYDTGLEISQLTRPKS